MRNLNVAFKLKKLHEIDLLTYVLVTSTNCFSAFLHKDNGQAILAGDPMQLGPVIVSELAKPQLDKSLLYRLISRFPYLRDIERFPTTGGHDPRLVTKLLDNYRAVPELLEFTSGRFYDGELIAHVSLNIRS